MFALDRTTIGSNGPRTGVMPPADRRNERLFKQQQREPGPPAWESDPQNRPIVRCRPQT